MADIKVVEKGWGREEIWAATRNYCGKLLHFETGSKFSMHFHAMKDETWYILKGSFLLTYIDTRNASSHTVTLEKGDVWRNEPNEPHQLLCLQEGTVIEVSTYDDPSDNYRVLPGDSQEPLKQ